MGSWVTDASLEMFVDAHEDKLQTSLKQLCHNPMRGKKFLCMDQNVAKLVFIVGFYSPMPAQTDQAILGLCQPSPPVLKYLIKFTGYFATLPLET